MRRLASHPLEGLESQFPKPERQSKEHAPFTQRGDALAGEEQMVSQEPQLLTFERISVSHPGEALQSANPVLQVKSQETPLQKAIALKGFVQTVPHEPQFKVEFKLTQILLQQPNPLEH